MLALPGSDHTVTRASLGASVGATALDTCQTAEAAVTWIENRPCDLVAVAGPPAAVVDALTRLRQHRTPRNQSEKDNRGKGHQRSLLDRAMTDRLQRS